MNEAHGEQHPRCFSQAGVARDLKYSTREPGILSSKEERP